MFYGGIGVIIGWVISLSVGSSIIYISYHIIEDIPLKDLFPAESKKLLLSCLFFVAVINIIQGAFLNEANIFISSIILLSLFLVSIFPQFWLHPMRKQLMGWISNELFNKKVELK